MPYICFSNSDSKKKIYIFTIFENSITIERTDDEWWLVYLPFTRNWHIDSLNKWCYYKCDQLWGLENFYNNMIFYLLNDTKIHNQVPKKIKHLSNKEKFPQFTWI